MTSVRQRRLATVCLIAAALLGVWAFVAAITGGFRIDVGPIRISSRNPWRIALLALVAAAIAWRWHYRDWLHARLNESPLLAGRMATGVVLVTAGTVLALGVAFGARAAAASDASGYVSQAELWRRGTLRIDHAYAKSLPWPEAHHTLTTLGYRVAPDGPVVPTYSPGVPLLMALGRSLIPCGAYLVGPISGALLVLFTFVLSRRVAGTAVAAVTAALVACSPVALLLMLQPMADVPAAAFWTGALAVAVSGTPRAALVSGILAAVAITIRPNLVPLALFPWLLNIARCGAIRPAMARTALYAAGSIPGALFIAWVNNYLYGSPFISGYGNVGDEAFHLANAWPNIRNYSAWWLESQGWLGFLFVPALFRLGRPRQREFAILIAFGITLCLLYVFYIPFEAWWFLRFLLPGVPIAFLLCADAIDWASRGSRRLRIVTLAAFSAVAGAQALTFLDLTDVLGIGVGEQRYVEPALHVSSALPEDAVIVAMQHSGSLRYYTGRLILRWDLLDPAALDRAVEAMHRRQVPVYAVLESWEEPRFRERFAGQRTLAELDQGPIAIARDGEIKLYPLAAPETGFVRVPVSIPRLSSRPCLEMSPDYERPKAIEKLSR